jgi:hypothetical protein
MRAQLAASASPIGLVAGGQGRGIEWAEVWKISAIPLADEIICSR